MLMPVLIFQKTLRKSTVKEYILHLKRGKELLNSGDLKELIKEGTAVQIKLRLKSNKIPEEKFDRSFAKFTMKGEIASAMQLLSGEKAGVLKLDI